MRSKNRKVKVIGLAGMLVAGLSAGGLPAEPVSAANGWDIDLNAGSDEAEASSVTISLGAETSSVTLNAKNPSKLQGIIKKTANVTIGATDGYTIKVSGNPNLTSGGNTIQGVSGATTLNQMSNRWGWYYADDNANCSESASYKGMLSTGETVGNGELSSTTTKTITMCFGAKIDASQPGGNYSNTVMISAVAQPKSVVTFGGITTMQEMTPSICSAAHENDAARLRDTRDGKYYWVTKLVDGNCWMSQNLDLNITTSNIKATDSDIENDWTTSSTYPAEATVSGVPTTSDYGTTSRHSADLGEYIINTPTAIVACANNSTGLSACSAQGFVNVNGWTASADPNFYRATTYKGSDGTTNCTKSANTAASPNASGSCRVYDAHYLVGVYYEWTAATAGTGGAVSSGKASGSICPKGWRLPDGSPAGGGSYYELLGKYGVNSTASGTGINGYQYNIALSPLFLARDGYISYAAKELRGAGKEGVFWTSDSVDSDTARHLLINENSVSPEYAATRAAWDGSEDRWFAMPVRCVAAKS